MKITTKTGKISNGWKKNSLDKQLLNWAIEGYRQLNFTPVTSNSYIGRVKSFEMDEVGKTAIMPQISNSLSMYTKRNVPIL